MPNNRSYAVSSNLIKLNFAGGTDSDNIALTEINNSGEKVAGSSQLRRIGFPANWVASSISFVIYEDDTFANGKILDITDGVDTIPLVIVSSASKTISLQAPWLDSVYFFQIISSADQPALEIDLITQPLYQVPA